jgi:hypothetical protein
MWLQIVSGEQLKARLSRIPRWKCENRTYTNCAGRAIKSKSFSGSMVKMWK